PTHPSPTRSFQVWDAVPFLHRRVKQCRQLREDGLGQIAESGGGRPDIVLAEDVAHADTKQFLVLKTAKHRFQARRPRATVARRWATRNADAAAQLLQLIAQL